MHQHAHAEGSAMSRYGALAAVIAAAALWGLGGVVASRLFSLGANPLEVVALRTWISAAGLLALHLWRGPRRLTRPFPWRLVLGFGLSIAVANGALFLAISRMPVAVVLVLQNLAPVFLIGWTLTAARRRPRPRMALGLLAALAGVVLVVQLPTIPLHDIDVIGVALGLLTAAAVAAFSWFGAKAVQACGALSANTGAFAVASLAWLMFQIPHGVPRLFSTPELLGGTVVIGIFGTLLPFLLFSWGTSRLGPQVGAVNISLEPIFGAALAWVWLGQILNTIQLVGAALLLIAVVDLQRSRDPGSVRGSRPSSTVEMPQAPGPPARPIRNAA